MGNPGRAADRVHRHRIATARTTRFVTIDTANAGWAMFDEDGNYVGERGYPKPKRNYKALEFMIDRAWDDRWSFNATYTLSFSKGNAEGPVNSDTNFARRGPHRGVRQSVGELRRRTATCRTTGAISSSCAARTRSANTGTFGAHAERAVRAGRSARSARAIRSTTRAFYSFYICVQLHGQLPERVRAAQARLRRPHAVDLRSRART